MLQRTFILLALLMPVQLLAEPGLNNIIEDAIKKMPSTDLQKCDCKPKFTPIHTDHAFAGDRPQVDPKACQRGLKADDFKSVFKSLSDVISDGFDPHLPHQQMDNSFNTHFDWHSSVHAHWAYLKMARLTGDKDLIAKIASRLTGNAFTGTMRLLRDHHYAHRPYGRAWLTLLFDEMKKNGLLEQRQERLAQSLARETIHYTNNRHADSDEHTNYDINLFLLSQAQIVSPQLKKALAHRIATSRRDLDTIEDQLPTASTYAFVTRTAIARLLDDSIPGDQPEPASLNQVAELIQSRTDIGAGHLAGLYATHLWPLAKYSRKDPKACEVYINRLNGLLDRRELWAQDFVRISHWIPQFIAMSSFLALGE